VWTRHVVTSDLAELPLTAIRPRDVEAFSRALRTRKAVHAITRGRGSSKRTVVSETTRPLSRAMQREALRLVRSVLDAAVLEELLERNPAESVEVTRGTASARDLSEDWLRWPEIAKLLGSEKIDARDRRAYACAIGLALRLNDLKAIEREHVELDCEVPGPCVRVWLAKPQRWHRVPVMPWLVPVVRAQLEVSSESRWLFPRVDGERYAKGFDFAWAEDRERDGKRVDVEPSALARAGIARRIRFHDLRGTCATHLALGTWGRRWSLHEIQSMLAHSDQRVTERYVRRAVDTLAEAAAATPGRPGLPMDSLSATGATSRNDSAPGPGLEPGTIRLTATRPGESSHDVAPSHGQRMGNLAREVVRLAGEGDPHALRRALELADAVLAYLAKEAVNDRLAELGR
jgi:integrase